MSETLHVLGEIVIQEQGSFKHVRQYLEGWYPEEGILHFGWSGQETIRDMDIISPLGIIYVNEQNEQKDIK